MAGRAYRTVTVRHVPAGDSHDACLIWIPLVGGTERPGVLGSTVGDVSAAMLAR